MYVAHYFGASLAFYLIYTFNIIFHVIGVCLLTSVHRYGKRSVQNLFLINLSAINIVKTVMNMLRLTADIKLFPDLNTNGDIFHRVVTINAFGLSLLYTFAMMFITTDVLGLIMFTSRYFTYWSCGKSCYFLLGIWLFGIVECTIIYAAHALNRFKNNQDIDVYIKTTLGVSFIILALVTYYGVFYKYIKSKMASIYRTNTRYQEGVRELFRKTKFYVAIVIITAFILLDIIPEVFLLLLLIIKRTAPNQFVLLFLYLNAFSDMVSVFIYICIRDDVRTTLLTKLRHICCRHTRRHRFDFPEDVWPDVITNQQSNPIIDRILELSTQV